MSIMREGLTRRAFMAGTAATSASLLAGCATAGRTGLLNGSPTAPVLKGFVIADAHFGWVDEQQPSAETQRLMLRHILDRFPDLDLLVDTGDIHHGGLQGPDGGLARRQWMDVIANGCGPLPFFYTPGNHEIMGTRQGDPEWRCAQLGSLSCRPYYSFDLKGIHFISLPEMIRAVYITQESLEWLALDLELNKDRTTILFSHNNIQGTTTGEEEGYRGLVNSKELLGLLNAYPNVLAYMHGHNHNYEVVPQDGKLFVSNGRFGGFDTSRRQPDGPYGLGGMYFEVRPTGITVRAYSAEKRRFLDKTGVQGVSGALETATSLAPGALPAYSYGSGGARDGERIPVYHHFAGQGPGELYTTGVSSPVFNEDPAFSYFMARGRGKDQEPHWQLMGALVRGPNEHWEWADPGLRILARDRTSAATVLTVPHEGHGQVAYYRCPPGRDYRATVELDAEGGGQTLQLTFLMHDREGRELANLPGPCWTLLRGRQTRTVDVEIPFIHAVETIYTNRDSDNVLHLMARASFSNLTEPVTLRRFDLAFSDASSSTLNPGILLDGAWLGHGGPVKPGEIVRHALPAKAPARSVVETHADGARRLTWLIRRPGLLWQVRNAAATMSEGCLEIGPARNPWSPQCEIIIAPLVSLESPFAARLRNVARARIQPWDPTQNAMHIELLEVQGEAEVELANAQTVRQVQGATDWRRKRGRVWITKAEPGTIQVSA